MSLYFFCFGDAADTGRGVVGGAAGLALWLLWCPVISTMMGRHLLLRGATAQTAEGLVLLRWSNGHCSCSAEVVAANGLQAAV